MKKRIIALLVAALLLLSACAAPAQPENAVVHYGISNAWDALMPYNSLSGSNYARVVYDKIFDRLAFQNGDGSLSPRAANSWEGAEGGMSAVFHLDPAAAFHDGVLVTAEHWVQTVALLTDAACPALGRVTFAALAGTDEAGVAIAGETLGAKALDDVTLKLTFKQPTTPENFLLQSNRDFYVLPTDLLGNILPESLMDAPLWRAPIGSGPCVFETEVAGSSITLRANKTYQLGAPQFEELVISVMDKANLLPALIAGDLDYFAFGGGVSVQDAPIARQNGLTVTDGSSPSTFYELMVNNETVAPAQLRRAISLATDKVLLAQQSAGKLGTATDTSRISAAPAQPRDVEGAKHLLTEAGYTGEVLTLACTASRSGYAALLQNNLLDAGILAEIVTVDTATLFSGMADGDYDLALASHTPGVLPLWFTQGRFTRENNLFHVADFATYQAYTLAVQSAQTPETQSAAVAEFEAYLAEEMPFVPLWFTTAQSVNSRTVRGIDNDASRFCNDNIWAWTMVTK